MTLPEPRLKLTAASILTPWERETFEIVLIDRLSEDADEGEPGLRLPPKQHGAARGYSLNH